MKVDPAPPLRRRITTRCPAKLNLALAVAAPDSDGLHPIASWMVTVDFFDDLVVLVGDDDLAAGFGPERQAAAEVAGEPHLVASLRLRGGKMASSSGVPGAVGSAADVVSAQGVQLPLLRNILDMTTSITAASNGSNTSGSTAGLDPERMAFLQNAFT